MLKFFDSTLRDGAHAVHQKLSLQNITDYCDAVDDIGMYTVIVGHGNGLGASSLNMGLSSVAEQEMLKEAKKHLNKTKLGVFLTPGFGTITDNLKPAFDLGAELVCIASHCTETNITRQHIEFSRKAGKETYGVVMLHHTIDDFHMLEQLKQMQDYGAMGVILMDSAGASLPEEIYTRFAYLKSELSIPVGFHAHNNLGMATINTIEAVKAGAEIVDGTMRGFGAGAGNCQLEVTIAVLEKLGIPTGIDLYSAMDISENIVNHFSENQKGISAINLISGLTGIVSTFAPHVREAAELFDVDYRDIFVELGKRKAVAGQEDLIVEVAAALAKSKRMNEI